MRAIFGLLAIGCILSLLISGSDEGLGLAVIPLWLPMALGAWAGADKAKKSQDAGREHDKFRKAVIKYSPWTEMEDPGAAQVQGLISGTIGGAAGGLSLGQGFNQMLPGGEEAAGAISNEVQDVADKQKLKAIANKQEASMTGAPSALPQVGGTKPIAGGVAPGAWQQQQQMMGATTSSTTRCRYVGTRHSKAI